MRWGDWETRLFRFVSHTNCFYKRFDCCVLLVYDLKDLIFVFFIFFSCFMPFLGIIYFLSIKPLSSIKKKLFFVYNNKYSLHRYFYFKLLYNNSTKNHSSCTLLLMNTAKNSEIRSCSTQNLQGMIQQLKKIDNKRHFFKYHKIDQPIWTCRDSSLWISQL